MSHFCENLSCNNCQKAGLDFSTTIIASCRRAIRCATSVAQNGDARIHIKRIYVHTRNLFFLVGSAELKLRSRLMIVSKNEALREPDRAEQADQTSSDALGNACVKTLFLRRPPQHPLTQVRMAHPSKARPPPFGPASRIPRNNGDLSLG
jgi:hypothetical protein